MSCGWSFADGWWSLQLSPGRRREAAPARAGHENSSFFLQCILTELRAWVCSALGKNKSLKCFCEMKTISKILLSDKNESDFWLTFSASLSPDLHLRLLYFTSKPTYHFKRGQIWEENYILSELLQAAAQELAAKMASSGSKIILLVCSEFSCCISWLLQISAYHNCLTQVQRNS